jgi:hypothetical protein
VFEALSQRSLAVREGNLHGAQLGALLPELTSLRVDGHGLLEGGDAALDARLHLLVDGPQLGDAPLPLAQLELGLGQPRLAHGERRLGNCDSASECVEVLGPFGQGAVVRYLRRRWSEVPFE